jgi:mRNA interferase MazF
MTYEAMRWRVFLANLDPTRGSEQRGTRPVVVVSYEGFNRVMPVVTVLPITSLKPGRRAYPNEVKLPRNSCGLRQDSLVLGHQVRTIDKSRLLRPVGTVIDHVLRGAVEQALRVHLDLAGAYPLL